MTRFPVLYSNASNVTWTHPHILQYIGLICAALLQDSITLLGRFFFIFFYPKQLRNVFELYLYKTAFS